MLRQPLTYWLRKHPVFWFTLTLTQSVRLPMVTYPSLCSPCVTYGTLCHAIGHQMLPTPAFSIILHPSASYCQVFRPILYFQPSSSWSDLQLYPNPSCTSYPGPSPARFHPGCDPSPPLPREAEDLPKGDNHSKHVPLPTYLAWLQPLCYNSWFVFIHVKTVETLLVVKTLIKYRAAAKPISSHEKIE